MHAMAREAADLARFFTDPQSVPPTLATARRATISGVVLERAPDHPDKEALREDSFRTLARHLAYKAALRDLIAAWNGVGVTPLLFKGFYLAEFVYPSPAQRVYNDVDVYVEPEHAERACAVATQTGWQVVWRADGRDQPFWARRGPSHGHEIAELHLRQLDIKLDLHRRLVHNSHTRVRWHRVQSRLTDAAVRAAIETSWEGLRVRVPRPVDAVVYGLALSRCWSADAWHVKPRDYADIEALRDHRGVTREELVERAKQLGVSRTVALFLRRCDPYRRTFVLDPPGWKVRWWNLRVIPERGFHDLIRDTMGARDFVADAVNGTLALMRTAPVAASAIDFTRRRIPIEEWVGRHRACGSPRGGLGRQRWRRFRRAIHRHQRLRRVDPSQRSTVATLAAFAWLRRHGYPAELVDIDGQRYAARLSLEGETLSPTPLAGDDHDDG